MDKDKASIKNSSYKNKNTGEETKSGGSTIQIPKIELPKGGGALRGIDEKFLVNPSNGTNSFTIPISFSPGRNNFTPSLNLNYNSGAGNCILGIGWSLDFTSIKRSTNSKLPTYDDDEDTFMLSGGEDLVPYLRLVNEEWKPEEKTENNFFIKRYRPRIEGAFERIEKISHPVEGTYWRVTTGDNVTTFFGYSTAARLVNPNDPTKIFKWLPEIVFNDKGDCIVYEYKEENLDNVKNHLLQV